MYSPCPCSECVSVERHEESDVALGRHGDAIDVDVVTESAVIPRRVKAPPACCLGGGTCFHLPEASVYSAWTESVNPLLPAGWRTVSAPGRPARTRRNACGQESAKQERLCSRAAAHAQAEPTRQSREEQTRGRVARSMISSANDVKGAESKVERQALEVRLLRCAFPSRIPRLRPGARGQERKDEGGSVDRHAPFSGMKDESDQTQFLAIILRFVLPPTSFINSCHGNEGI